MTTLYSSIVKVIVTVKLSLPFIRSQRLAFQIKLKSNLHETRCTLMTLHENCNSSVKQKSGKKEKTRERVVKLIIIMNVIVNFLRHVS